MFANDADRPTHNAFRANFPDVRLDDRDVREEEGMHGVRQFTTLPGEGKERITGYVAEVVDYSPDTPAAERRSVHDEREDREAGQFAGAFLGGRVGP